MQALKAIFVIIKRKRKMRLASLAVAAVALSLASCGKIALNNHGPKGGKNLKPTITSEQTITVAAGETVTIALPIEDAHDAYAIITQATKAANSAVVEYKNYSYTAPTTVSADVTTDEVVVTNDHHQYPEIGHVEIPGLAETGKCGPPQHYIVKVHINLTGVKAK
jgi:transketolase